MTQQHSRTSAEPAAARHRDQEPADRPVRGSAPAALLLLAAVAATLVAQFAMDSLADQSDIWHWAQHAVLFWSGVAAGAALLLLYRRGQRRV